MRWNQRDVHCRFVIILVAETWFYNESARGSMETTRWRLLKKMYIFDTRLPKIETSKVSMNDNRSVIWLLRNMYRRKWDLREAGVELGAKLLDRQDGVLVLGMRTQRLVYAAALAVAGQGDVAPGKSKETKKIVRYNVLGFAKAVFFKTILQASEYTLRLAEPSLRLLPRHWITVGSHPRDTISFS